MVSRVVKCGVGYSEGLVSTVFDQGRVICQNCGTVVSDSIDVDHVSHTFFDFIGAYCPIDKMIHYRWIPSDWSIRENSLLSKKNQEAPIIIPKKTEISMEQYFIKSHFWQNDGRICFDPGFREVLWSDWEESKFVLLRPSDTGYLKVNPSGMHTPFIAALIEWLLKRSQWSEIGNLAENSIITSREKKIIKHAISQPTPSNIFKFIWTFKKFIPGWNPKRSLGKRSPSMLIIDEIRWTTNRINDLDQTDRDRLIKYGPEPYYWGIKPELWPKDIPLGENLAEFGPELKRLGIAYDQTLELIDQPDLRNDEKSWMEIAEMMIEWPINFKKGGIVDAELSQRISHGFVPNLKNNLVIGQKPKNQRKNNQWVDYLTINLPLVWEKNGKELHFQADGEILTIAELQETLKVLQPWISKECNEELILEVNGDVNGLRYHWNSFAGRVQNTTVILK